ncbi:DUF3750 domain-containing protein [Marinobacter salicampi]|uniref:DUF3750 domain-containing protein n=1 Tax=Marinobacter salicampi TaxID=435907 RepID=UPI0014096E5E|nr:DUF3750 domain-containing protein [Marinobacter salicampi]
MMTTFWWLAKAGLLLLLLLAGPLFMAASSNIQSNQNWFDADRSSAGIAPRAEGFPEAIVQVYGARAFGWRGYFAVHTWIATKQAGASSYVVHDVTGWGSHTVRSRPGVPDRAWYGNAPRLIADFRGQRAAELIPEIQQAVADYPYPNRYEAWPGPNSNTFVAWVIRQVPELDVALPNTAIGKDYLGDGYISRTPGGLGYQVSANGYVGLLASVREGLELNIMGLSLGIDPLALAIKLPGVGHLGFRDPWMDKADAATETGTLTGSASGSDSPGEPSGLSLRDPAASQ